MIKTEIFNLSKISFIIFTIIIIYNIYEINGQSLDLSNNNDDTIVIDLNEQQNEGVIGEPLLLFSLNNSTTKRTFKAKSGYRIVLFLKFYDLNGCDDKSFDYLVIGPIYNKYNLNNDKNLYFNSCNHNNFFKEKHIDGTYLKFESVHNYIALDYVSNFERTSIAFEILYRTYYELSNQDKNCNVDEIKCKTSNRCVSLKYKCDCYNDCFDLTDEFDCNVVGKQQCNNLEIDLNQQYCLSDQIYCIDYYSKKPSCKPLSIRCDYNSDCIYNIDEYNCSSSNSISSTDDNDIFNFNNDNNCINVYRTDNYGQISSPNYPLNNYDLGINCSYHIIVEPYQKVQIRIKKLKLRPYFLTNYLNFNSNKPSYINYITNNIIDYDYLSIYDGDNIYAPLIAHLNSQSNDVKQKIFNSKSNSVFILFHTSKFHQDFNKISLDMDTKNDIFGFNLTYQVKGFCIDNQLSCSSYTFTKIKELNCFDNEQRCDDVWDCHNGADEHTCGNMCPPDHYRCKNKLSCYKYEERCDGDHQCIDKSDENNCDSWFCNSDNGTFLCNNKRCIYEQWVCDGTNDCEDGSDEVNCPTPFTRRVITTAVLGGTLCLLLLVMALGCACKLYTLRTIDYHRVNSRQISSRRRRERNLNRSNQTTRRTFSLLNLIRRNNNNSQPTNNQPSNLTTPSTSQNQTTTQNTNNNSNSIYRLVRSASTSSIDYQNLIAPPTYNQTMGLVDEYEQRQLAFIEHVRSMINSNNINLTNNPTTNVGNSSSSRSNRRRSHSARHLSRLAVQNNNDSQNLTTTNPSTGTTATVINLNDQTVIHTSSRHHRRRHHRHHRQNHHHHHHHYHDQNNCNSHRRSNNHHTSSLSTSTIQPRPTTLLPQQHQQQQQQQLQQDNNNQQVNNISKVTTNLKDRLAKLIKDIVNHGDNIQYVQLSDTSQRSPNINHQHEQTIPTTQSIPLETTIIHHETQQQQFQQLKTNDNERDDAKLLDS